MQAADGGASSDETKKLKYKIQELKSEQREQAATINVLRKDNEQARFQIKNLKTLQGESKESMQERISELEVSKLRTVPGYTYPCIRHQLLCSRSQRGSSPNASADASLSQTQCDFGDCTEALVTKCGHALSGHGSTS